MSRSTYELTLTSTAEEDFLEMMQWSALHFGDAAADRYEALIGQALVDLAENPLRPGAADRSELMEGLRVYHLAGSRDRVSGDRVHAPRHFVLYRLVGLRVEVLRFLHDSRDLVRHLPEA